MSELAEQIHNPVTPEFALAEAPEPSLPDIPAQPPAPELSQPEDTSQDEVALTAEIAQLWQVHQDCQSAMKHETIQFRSLRSELGRLLHEMKALLAKPGRGGEWSGWLRERKIPRATADRLVTKHERSLHPDGNCLIESIAEPTDEEIKALLEKTAPKIRKLLRTPASAYKFIEALVASFVLEHWVTEEGFFLVKPSAPIAVEQSVPDAAQADPVPVIADVLAEGNVESTGASMAL